LIYRKIKQIFNVASFEHGFIMVYLFCSGMVKDFETVASGSIALICSSKYQVVKINVRRRFPIRL